MPYRGDGSPLDRTRLFVERAKQDEMGVAKRQRLGAGLSGPKRASSSGRFDGVATDASLEPVWEEAGAS